MTTVTATDDWLLGGLDRIIRCPNDLPGGRPCLGRLAIVGEQ